MGNSQFELVQCSKVYKNKKNKHMILFPFNQINSAHARHILLSCVNVTGLLLSLQVKVENIYLPKIIIK